MSFLWTKPLVTRLPFIEQRKNHRNTGIKCIQLDEIPENQPYASTMDLSACGLLKRALGKRHPRTLRGLWKTIEEEWSEIGMAVQRKNLLSPKIQARAIVKNHGYKIEANCLKKYGIYG
ncbi:hypothetical protein TNCV_807581 [Trichonephila clavipes]|nr:hypothetical protein TNCV_807581 [Trichonephila clavipes]